jgi:phytoene dehydrogenase-like protein
MVDAVVIGSGVNGLVAANLLADAGWSVTVLEAEVDPGGAVRSAETVEPGFVHDRFSSFYPFAAISPPLQRFGLEDHGLRWRRAPHVLAHVRPGERAAILASDLDATSERLESERRGDGRAWRGLIERWQRLEPGFRQAFFTPFPPLLGAARMAARVDPRDLVRLVRFLALPVRRMGDEQFGGPDGRDLLAGNALHADLPPEAVGSGAFGWIMCGLGQTHGFPIPEGGSGNLTRALVRRLETLGGSVRCATPVARVAVRDGRAVGVATADGEEVRARRAVLADLEAPTLYLRLVGPEHLSRRVLADLGRFERDWSTVKVDWSLDGPVPWSDPEARRAGTLHLAAGVDELSEATNQIARRLVPSDPFLVMGQYAATDPTRQPEGKETLWAYTHVPHAAEGDAGGELSGAWREGELERFADRIEARIEACAPGFRGLVRHRTLAGPADLEDADRNLVGGAINGGTAQIYQLALFRPIPAHLGRPETPIRGLYLAGASAHPAGGVHGAPGAIAARAALAHDAPRRLLSAPARGIRRSGSARSPAPGGW